MTLSPALRLRLECAALFGIPPLLIYVHGTRTLMIAMLWGGAALAWWLLKHEPGFSLQAEWNWRAVTRPALDAVLQRFCMAAFALLFFTFFIAPQSLFSFPLQRPLFWALVMLLYPVLSVVPQELVFRSLFFRRYADACGRGLVPVLISGLAFGYIHIFLSNAVAVLLAAFGGILFADTYARHRSLALVSFEHALYGCWVFTLGLGRYFYSGYPLHG